VYFFGRTLRKIDLRNKTTQNIEQGLTIEDFRIQIPDLKSLIDVPLLARMGS